MAEFPAMQIWTDAYLADTRDLSLEEHGAYMILLMVAWRSPNGLIENNDKRIARMLGVTLGKWEKIKPKIIGFFSVNEKFLEQKRIKNELDKLHQKKQKAKQNIESRWLKNKETDYTGVLKNEYENDTESILTRTITRTITKQQPSSITSASQNEPAVASPEEKKDWKKIINAFDEARAAAFGESQRRSYPAQDDRTQALKFLEAGASVDLCRSVFDSVFQRQKSQGRQPIGSLAYFAQAIANAIAASKSPMPAPDSRKPFAKPSDSNEFKLDERTDEQRREMFEYWAKIIRENGYGIPQVPLDEVARMVRENLITADQAIKAYPVIEGMYGIPMRPQDRME